MKRNIIFRTIVAGCVALTTLLAPQASAFPSTHYAQSSKLSQGNWVKIKVSESGMYQITDAQAREWGFSGTASLHVFGMGGAPISEALTSDIPDDLPQLPVVRSAGKLLFYAQGPTTWSYDGAFRHKLHPYSTEAYYFVTDDSNYADVDITRDATPVQGEAATTFTERLFHEKEIINQGKTGRDMLGEDFIGTPLQTLSFDLKGKVSGTNVKVITTTGVYQASSTGTGKFTFQYNGTNLPESSIDAFKYENTKYLIFTPKTMTKTFAMEGEKLNYSIKMTLNGANMKVARLNAVIVNYERALSLADGQQCIATPSTWLAGKAMKIANAAAGAQVWDVTEAHKPVAMNAQADGTNLTFATASGGFREYVAFDPSRNYPVPAMVEHVANQDIHAMDIPDMIIISHSRYMPQAQRVAQLHESQDSMRVLVLPQEAIFNEFSGGTPDFMAYRMLCKYFYDRGTDAKGHHLQYALLMGGGSFDNKQISSEFKSIAFPALLTWQNENSRSESNAINSDIAIGILKDNTDAKWGDLKMDIAVGRFPVKSEEDARVAVDKLIKYVTTPSYGPWRSNIIMLADDEETHPSFMVQSDSYISAGQDNGGKDYMFKRVYLDAYEAVSVGATRTYPGARDALYGGLRDGALVWCYNGHSSPNVISDHDLVRRNDYLNNMFYKHLPLMIGTTCDLARYDAIEACGGEHMFLNKNGGAIAVLSTTRSALMVENGILGKNMFAHMFTRDENGLPRRLGDILRLGHNEQPKNNDLVYMLMGDPAMRLAMPYYQARIETINGQPIDPENLPVFKARQTITFTGKIVDTKGNKVNNFNGSVQSDLYDCEQSVTTHGYGKGEEYTYQEHGNRIAIVSDSVKNGEFSIKVTIPSEIIYSYDNYTPSLITLYAYDASHNYDAIGSSEDFYVYGYDETVKADTVGPHITYMGLNSENFSNGDDVNESPLVIASLYDESGINLSDDGIGHSMALILDDKQEYTNVSKYYTPTHSPNGGYRGTISFPMSGLSNGTHTLRLRVWDIFSNMSEKTITFNVVNGLKPDIYEVYATKNPASTETTFYVKHNRPDANINLGIQVYDLMGRMVWSTQQSGQSDMFTSFPVTWNLTDMAGNRVPRGIYVYRAIVSTDGVREATKSKKIAVTGE